jgi:hypothetical protein
VNFHLQMLLGNLKLKLSANEWSGQHDPESQIRAFHTQTELQVVLDISSAMLMFKSHYITVPFSLSMNKVFVISFHGQV